MPDRKIITNISSQYYFKVLEAFANNAQSIKAIEGIAKALNEIYRYIEPEFFIGEFYVCKNFNDALVLNEEEAIDLYDRNLLLNRVSGTLIIQIFADGKLLLWENEDPSVLSGLSTTLTYMYSKNKEFFLANGKKIDITIYPRGSRFATQYMDLMEALNAYKVDRVYRSSCSVFSKSWFDGNRLFFKGEGRGKNAPEKHMQESLYEFLRTQTSLRGISFEVLREFNVESGKPKPVDIRIQWKEANRVALIEIKWLGAIKDARGKLLYTHDTARANDGATQLKGYYDAALSDTPTSIVKSFLIVIDGRRNNLKKSDSKIKFQDGMYFQEIEIEFDDDKKYHASNPGISEPLRMFASPICI